MPAKLSPARIPNLTPWSAFSVEKKEVDVLLALWADAVSTPSAHTATKNSFFIVVNGFGLINKLIKQVITG
jgi:hypothetical protein